MNHVPDLLETWKTPTWIWGNIIITKKHLSKLGLSIGNAKNNVHYDCTFVPEGGTVLPSSKLACFLLYLKIVNTFLKINTCILW